MEEMLNAGKKKEALSYLSLCLKEGGAPRLSTEVERMGRPTVGGFSLDDIMALAPLSDEQGEMVMERLADEFDAELGMNWESIKETIDSLFEKSWDFAPRGQDGV